MAVVITPEAVEAAMQAWMSTACGSDHSDMRAAIEAALPHLTDTGEPLAELPPTLSTADVEALGRAGWTTLEERFDRLERLLHDQWANRFDTAQPLTVLEAELSRSKETRDRQQWHATLAAEQHTSERLAIRLDQEIAGTPTDYEVWRDALLIAATAHGGVSDDPRDVANFALTYYAELRNGVGPHSKGERYDALYDDVPDGD